MINLINYGRKTEFKNYTEPEVASNKIHTSLDKKCGDITFCIQLDKRVYALNCLYCQEICFHWDAFVDHMEQIHSEELDADSIEVLEDYETELFKELKSNETLSEQNETWDSNHNVEDETNQSFLCDPLEDKDSLSTIAKDEIMDVSIAPLSNSPALSEDLNDNNNSTNECLSEEISSQSSLCLMNDNSTKKNIWDNPKLTECIIKYYKQHTVLWKSDQPENKNFMKRHEAYENITNLINKEMNLNLRWLQIKTKINYLKGRFRKEDELIREFSVNKNLICGKDEKHCEDSLAASNKIQSVSGYYEEMSFLKDYINDDSKLSKRDFKGLSNEKCNLPLANLSLEENKQFIEFYKSYPCLWDVNHMGYRCKNQRDESLQALLETINTRLNLNLSINNLQRKLYSIRYAITHEKHREIKYKQEFIPQCQLYNELLFLKDCVGPFKCEYCEQIFNGPNQYKVHKSSHDGSMPYTCPHCKKGFMTLGNCTVHIRRHTKDFQFECGVCGKKFATSTDFNVHVRRHTGEKPYFCDICGLSFSRCTNLDAHKKRHEKNKAHKCTICSKSFYENNTLNQHMKAHLNIRDKVCNVCGKSFTCTKNLNQHKLIHAEKKKYSCKICGKNFAQPAGLSSHLKSHDAISNSSIIFNSSEFNDVS